MPDSLPPCPTPCDPDCEAECHEIHVGRHPRGHQPWGCHEVRAAIAGWVMVERTRIIAKARELGATYPVTIPAANGELGARHTAFPFADYLEDVRPPEPGPCQSQTPRSKRSPCSISPPKEPCHEDRN